MNGAKFSHFYWEYSCFSVLYPYVFFFSFLNFIISFYLYSYYLAECHNLCYPVKGKLDLCVTFNGVCMHANAVTSNFKRLRFSPYCCSHLWVHCYLHSHSIFKHCVGSLVQVKVIVCNTATAQANMFGANFSKVHTRWSFFGRSKL